MNLYELTGKYKQLVEMEEEMDPTLFHDTLDSLEDAIEYKAENIAMIIQQFKADAKNLKEEEQRFAKRRQAIENKIGNLQEYLYNNMKEVGADKIKSPRFTIYIQKNPMSVNITNEALIPDEYFIPQEPKLDKKSLKEDMQLHGEIPGAELVQSEGVRVR